MRSWSGEFADEKKGDAKSDAAAGDAPAPKRLRTRSMDKAEAAHKVAAVEKAQSPAEWRKMHSIAVRGHGKNAAETKFPDPFLEFDDAPFNPALQRTLKAAGFERPTFIQSQVRGLCPKHCNSSVFNSLTRLASHHCTHRPGRSPSRETT